MMWPAINNVAGRVAALSLVLVVVLGVQARRDPLTPQEADLVREAQEIDTRTEIFLKIAERRLIALDPAAVPAGPPSGKKESEKDRKKREAELERWGPPPTGTRIELLGNYSLVIDELEDKIEDVFERTPKAPALRKAMGLLETTAAAHLDRLRREVETRPPDAKERRAFESTERVLRGALDGAKEYLGKP